MSEVKGIFITGTDTDCGKTYVTSLILQALRQERVDAVGYKPICCGDRNDAVMLAAASDNEVSVEEVNPVWMKTPAAPHVASIFENRVITPEELSDGYHKLAQKHNHILVEGVGGWCVPIRGKEYGVPELAVSLGLPVLLVVGNRLGALNHAMLTIQAIRRQGIEPVGMVFNNLEDEMQTATITNKGIIEDMTGVEVLTDVIYGQEEIESWPFLEILGL